MSDDTEKDTQIPPAPKGVGNNGNLIPPQAGEVRNPNGRPKGSLNRATIYKRLLEAAAVETIRKEHRAILGDELANASVTIADQIAAKDIMKALAGEDAAMQRVFDNVEGKLAETQNINGVLGLGGILAEIDKRGPDPLPNLKKPDAQCTTKPPLPRLKPSNSPPSSDV